MAVVEELDGYRAVYGEVIERLAAFGIERDSISIGVDGKIALAPGDMLHVLDIEAQTGFRSPFALGRALDERRRYSHLGILAIQLDLSGFCDVDNPLEVDAVLRHLSRNVRALDACYRSIDTTLILLMPETGTRSAIMAVARRLRAALAAVDVPARIGASVTNHFERAHGHEYLGTALAALVDADRTAEGIGFMEV